MGTKIKEQYGLFTTVNLIIGIVIGSGIYFKTDDILKLTNGNILLTVFGFLFVGFGIVFGALVVSRYALMNDQEGGIIAYSKQLLGKKYGYTVGWFMVAVYFPALVVILAQVAAIYTLLFLGINSTSAHYYSWILVTGLIYILMAYSINILSIKAAGRVQDLTTILKLIPIFFIAFLGIFFTSGTTVQSVQQTNAAMASGFFASLVPIAFIFDGWIVSTGISAEVKNSKKNLPRALVVGTMAILFIYLIYIIGVSMILGPDKIILLGDSYINNIGEILFGNAGSKVMILFVIISVYGGLHGMMLTMFRLPHALVKDDLMKDFWNISEISGKYGISMGAVKFTIVPVIIFVLLQVYIVFSNGYLKSINFDISSLPVIVNYIFYTILFLGVIKFIREGIVSKTYYIYIFIASIISIIIILGSFSANGLLYIVLSILTILGGIPLRKIEEN